VDQPLIETCGEMEKSKRGDLLRKRFKAIGGLAYIGRGRKRAQERRAQPWFYSPLPGIIPDTKRAPAWMLEAQVRITLTPGPERRRKGEAALTRIARQLLTKLPLVDLSE